MATELALQAYVFLGNSLNFLVNGAGAPQWRELGTTEAGLRELHAKVEPLTANSILDGVGALAPEDRAQLLRVCLWCVNRLGDELESVAGVTRDEAGRVIAWLEQDVGGG